MEPLIYDYQNPPTTSEQVGNKAYALYEMNQLVDVPRFITLDAQEMLRILSLNENKEIAKELKAKWITKLNLAYFMETFHMLIGRMYIPRSWIETLIDKLKKEKISGPFAVRASSIYEDSAQASAPGVFHTVLDVNETNLQSAIIECWSSNFSSKTAYYFGNHIDRFEDIKMGVIIQSMQYGEMSGVMFTANPVTGKKEIVVETTASVSNYLTDGHVSGKRYFLSETCDGQEPAFLCKLRDVGQRIKTYYNRDVDIEWTCSKEKIYILQVRPISTKCSRERIEAGVFSISEISRLDIKGALIQDMIIRWRGKKQHFSRACDKRGIRRLEWFFTQNYHSDCYEEVQEHISRMYGKYVTLAINKLYSDVVIERNQVISYLKMYSKRDIQNNIISIREIPYNQVSVISTMLEDGAVYLEVADGVIKALKQGDMPYSTYRIKDGEFLEKKEIHNQKRYDICLPSGDFELIDNEINSYTLYEEQFLQIAKATMKLWQEEQTGAIEWWLCDGEVFAADISLYKLSKEIDIADKDRISKGVIDGYAFKLDETIWEEISLWSYGQAISVDSYHQELDMQAYMQEIRGQIKKQKEKGNVILCAKSPLLSLAPLLDLVDGCVFQEASLLCHMAIMLREKGIPAVVMYEGYRNIESGQAIFCV